MPDNPAPHAVDARLDAIDAEIAALNAFNREAQALKGSEAQLGDACNQLLTATASLGAVLQAYDAGRTRR